MAIYRRGKRYWIDFTHRGKRFREPAGHSYELARRLLTQRWNEVESGNLLPRAKRITLRQWADRYREWAREHKRSWKRDELSVTHLLRHLGDRYLDDIAAAVVEDYQRARRGEKTRFDKAPTPATINREVACLKKMLSLAVRDRVLAVHPARGIEMLDEHNARERILSEEEIERIQEKAPRWLRPIVVLGFWTGMRRTEIVMLTWDRIDLREGFIRLRAEDTKTHDGRSVPVAEPALEELRRLPRPLKGDGRVFDAHPDAVSKAFAKACKDAGITGATFHDLRHTAVTRWADAGFDEALIMKATGHRTAAVFRRYRTVTESRLRALAEAPRHNGDTSSKKARRNGGN